MYWSIRSGAACSILLWFTAGCGPDAAKVEAFEKSTDALCSCIEAAGKKTPDELEEFPCSAEKTDFYDKYSAEFFGEPLGDKKLEAVFERGRACEKLLDAMRVPR